MYHIDVPILTIYPFLCHRMYKNNLHLVIIGYSCFYYRGNYDTYKAMVEERGQSMELALSLTHTTCLAGYSKKFLAVSVYICHAKTMVLMCCLI